jgi:hypothetical protein
VRNQQHIVFSDVVGHCDEIVVATRDESREHRDSDAYPGGGQERMGAVRLQCDSGGGQNRLKLRFRCSLFDGSFSSWWRTLRLHCFKLGCRAVMSTPEHSHP